MTDQELKRKLKNFDKVWQRVQNNKPKAQGGAKLMPQKQMSSYCTRHDPRRKF